MRFRAARHGSVNQGYFPIEETTEIHPDLVEGWVFCRRAFDPERTGEHWPRPDLASFFEPLLELIAKLIPMGLMGPMMPEEYGGSYSDVVTYGVICEELARIDWVIASVVSVANSLVGGSILRMARSAVCCTTLPM